MAPRNKGISVVKELWIKNPRESLRLPPRNKVLPVSYSDYINGPAWAAKKRQFKSQRELLCECCKDDRKLDVHHLTYERLYNERLSDLMLLCRRCHEAVEQAIQRKRLTRKGNTKKLRADTVAFLRGYLSVKPTRRKIPNEYLQRQHAARIAFHKKLQDEARERQRIFDEKNRLKREAKKAARKFHKSIRRKIDVDYVPGEIRSEHY